MRLVDRANNLSPRHIKELCDTLLDMSLLKETGGDFRMVLTRAKNRTVGNRRKIYETLETLPDADLEKISAALCGDL